MTKSTKRKIKKRPHRKLTEVRNDKLNAAGYRFENILTGMIEASAPKKPAEAGNSSSLDDDNLPGLEDKKAQHENEGELEPDTNSSSCEEINHQSSCSAELSGEKCWNSYIPTPLFRLKGLSIPLGCVVFHRQGNVPWVSWVWH